jgi:SSS family solute:Na+ symporter
MHPHFVDYLIVAIYFVFVLGIGFALRSRMKTSEDFFLSGRSIPGWITGLAFMSANLGALEVMGHCANAAKYGMFVNHFYWLAAMPAMCFVGVFMMPFYYGSKVRSVPEFLRKRYDEKTRTLNALCFAFMTLLVSGVDLYAMAILFQRLLNWPFPASVVASAVVVAIYIYLGGLTSSIYNEVLQFFLIVFGFLPMAILGLKAVGGWAGLDAKLAALPYPGYGHTWANIWHTNMNPMGVNWIGTIFGLGFVMSFGYWCTDFLVVQRGLAAKDMASAQRTPLIAAVPKMFFPLMVVLPGLVAISYAPIRQLLWDPATHDYNYNQALPTMLGSFYPSGLLGLGLTALLASFMSGMAGNVTAFNTVWTFDIYQTHLNPGKPDKHYLQMGKLATIFAVIVGIGTAFIVLYFNNLMDYLQFLFALFNAPLFATFLLGMFSKRATPTAGFWGLLCGVLAATTHYILLRFHVFQYPGAQAMANNFYQAMWAFGVCFIVTLVVSSFTARKPDEELVGLVYQVTPKPKTSHLPWYERPGILAIGILALCAVLNIIFW